jgi:CRP-like cAMP-binding protein
MPLEFQNEVLRALPAEEAERLMERGSRVELEFAKTLYEAGDQVEWVYFPEGAIISMIVATEDGRTAESGMVGSEGVLGLIEACGSGLTTFRSVVQVPGPAWRAPASACRTLADESAGFRRAIWAQLEFQLAESRQSATCRSFHAVEQRLARWLLESRDRDSGQDSLPMTQEFMSAMLGVQRTTVTAFARELQGRGLIEYSRGKVRFIDPDGLEDLACECRQVLVRERERLTQQG